MQGEDTAPRMHLGRHPAAVSKMAADSLQLKRTKSWALKRRSSACPAHSRSGPPALISVLSRLCLSPGCRAAVPWGSGQSLYLGDKWLLQGLFHLAVGHGHHQPRSLLMRNAQDIHGRGHRSEWLALNYIFLTANYF